MHRIIIAAFAALALAAPASAQQTCAEIALGGKSFYTNNATYLDDELHPWAQTSPEQQGMKSATLAAGFKEFARDKRAVGMLVVRNGILVFEGYANGKNARQANNIHSAAKSVTSALTGIAIREGFIQSVDQPIYQLLPKLTFASWAKAITVKHLLTHRAGWKWTDEQDEERVVARSSNWCQAIVSCPKAYTPGTHFTYSSANSHLLGAIIAEASGQSLCEFSRTHLWGPLGIDVEKWGVDPQGYFGRDNLYITPREFARFGQLYCDDGYVGLDEIVPAQWVADSKKNQGSGYSYMWWVMPQGKVPCYVAWGYGGQFIYVLPNERLVVAFTQTTNNGAYGGDRNSIVQRYVLGAIAK